MNQVYLLGVTAGDKKEYLRYGLNGGDVPSYCLYRGCVACFFSREEADRVRKSFVSPDLWEIETFTR